MGISEAEYHRRKDAGICTKCTGPRDRDDRVYCEACREYFKEHDRKRDADPERRKRKVEGNRALRESNPAKYNRIAKYSLDRLRRKVYEAYGDKCVCCGESNPLFLTIDHINNDGAQHRRALNRRRRGSDTGAILRWARDNNYPDTLQLLCWNCNCGRQRNGGVCPHKEKQSW